MAATSIGWPRIAERLSGERSYWLCTVGRDGAPHVVPVWGVVVSDVWYGYSERRTVKAGNLRADPRVALHLDGGDDVLIVHGVLDDLGHPRTRPDILDAFARKYSRAEDRPFLPSEDPAFDVLYALSPLRAVRWRLDDYDNTQARWVRGNDAC